MANTTIIVGNTLQIKGLDADWSLPGDMAGFDESGLRIRSITFNPSAANDVMIIKDADPGYASTAALITALTATAPAVFRVKCSGDTDQRVKYFGHNGRNLRPFIDISDCTLSSAASAFVEMELA